MSNKSLVEGIKGILEDMGVFCKAPYNRKDLAQIIADSLVIAEEEIWKVFTKAKGCKPSKEDCNFKSCHSWGGCEVMAEAITENKNLIRVEE